MSSFFVFPKSGCLRQKPEIALSDVLSGRIDGYPLTILAELFKRDNTINFGKQCVIPTTTDILTRMYPGTKLPNQDISGPDNLSAESFHTPSLPCTVTAVS